MTMTTTGIDYETTATGAAVVFLHGVTLDGRMWRDQEAVLADAGVTSCCVVGHSLGGWDAIRLAHRPPDAVASLVLVDSWFPLPPMDWAPPVEVARSRGVTAGRAAWLADPLFASAVRDPSLRARLSEMVEGNDLGLWTADIPSSESSVDPAELVAAVRVPTLVTAGALDLPGFVAVTAWLAENLAGADPPSAVLVEGAGHMPPMEAPEALSGALERFLVEHTRGRRAPLDL